MYTRPIKSFKLSETKRKFFIAFLCSSLFIINSHGQWLNDYCYRKAITINASQVSGTGTHADFPLMISMSNDNELRSRTNAGLVESDFGNDIRFTDIGGVNLLDFEIEDYDEANGDLVAWVRIPTLSATTNTDIYIYFGNPTATSYPTPDDTWNSNYLGVWHTNTDASDATTNGNDGDYWATTDAAGIAGRARAFNGDDSITLPNIHASEGTFSFWMNLDNDFDNTTAITQALVSKDQNHDNYFSIYLCGSDYSLATENGHINFEIGNSVEFPKQISTTSSWTAGNWYMISGRWGTDDHSLLVNGVEEDSESVTRSLKNGGIIVLGKGYIVQNGVYAGYGFFDGIMDEVRLSDVNRSDAWLSTEYNNLSNPTAFRSIGSLEENPPSPNAGADTDVCDILSHTLSATFNTVSSRQWSYVSGPDPSPVFSDPSYFASSVTVSQYGTYVFRWTETNGSCSNSDDVLIHFQESPQGLATPPNEIVCFDNFFHEIILSTSNGMDAVTTYAWTRDKAGIVFGIPASGTGNISGPLHNITPEVQLVTFTITPTSAAGCQGADFDVTIEVFPEIQIDYLENQVICSFESTDPIHFSSFVASGTMAYTWVNTEPSIGLAPNGSGDILPFPALNFGVAPVVAYITVLPELTYNGLTCMGNAEMFTITINPMPQLNSPPDQVVCNNDPVWIEPFHTDLVGGTTSYNWFNNNPLIGLPAAGEGDIPPFTAFNFGMFPEVTTIDVLPHFEHDGHICDGPMEQFTITVNPTAQVDQPADLVLDHGENIPGVTFTTVNIGGITNYSWTNDDPTIGLAASGTDDIPPFVAVNSSEFPRMATILVTPEFTSIGPPCSGPAVEFRITVNPTVSDAFAGVDQDICGTLTINLDANNPSIGTGTWTQISGPGTVVYGDANVHNTSATASLYGTYVLRWTMELGGQTSSDDVTISFMENPVDASSGPNQDLCGRLTTRLDAIAHAYQAGSDHSGSTALWEYVSGPDATPVFSDITSPTSEVIVSLFGTYVFRWTETNGICYVSQDLNIDFQEGPIGQSTPDNQLVCSNTIISSIEFSTINGMDAGTTYAWSRDNTANVSGIPNTGTGTISGTLYNWTGVEQMVTFTVLPTSDMGCDGNAFTATVMVYPEPIGSPSPTIQWLCSGTAITDIVLSTWNGMDATTTYTWTRDNIASVSGLPNSGTSTISGTPVNHTDAVQWVTYTITPSSIQGCQGDDTTTLISVNPMPTIQVDALDTTLCNGGTAIITVTNPNDPIQGTWIYDLLVTPDAEISGSMANQTGRTPGLITETLTNHDTFPHRVVYQFIPRISPSDAGVDCTGRDTTIVIWVNPTAHVHDPTDHVVNNNDNTTAVTFTSNTQSGSTEYSWVNNSLSIGLSSNGIGNIPSFTAINSGTLPVVATITVTPEFSNLGISCTGPDEEFTITVNPSVPEADAGPDQDNCATLATNLEGNDPMVGTGTWTQVSGLGTVVFGDFNQNNTSVTSPIYGTYVLRWTITFGGITTQDDLTIIFREDPVGASAGADQLVCGVLTTTLEGIAHTYQTNSEHTGSTMQWDYVSGPDNNPVFSDNTLPASEIMVTLQGSYVWFSPLLFGQFTFQLQ
jgi:hypothetical protein